MRLRWGNLNQCARIEFGKSQSRPTADTLTKGAKAAKERKKIKEINHTISLVDVQHMTCSWIALGDMFVRHSGSILFSLLLVG